MECVNVNDECVKLPLYRIACCCNSAIKREKYCKFHFFFFLQFSADSASVCHSFLILRECVAAKSAWRPVNLGRMVDLGATEVVAKAAVRLFHAQESGESRQIIALDAVSEKRGSSSF
jgi:hypothetical protein